MIEFTLSEAKKAASCLRPNGAECCHVVKGEKTVLIRTSDHSRASTRQVCLNEGLRLIRNQLKMKDKNKLTKLIVDPDLKKLLKEKT